MLNCLGSTMKNSRGNIIKMADITTRKQTHKPDADYSIAFVNQNDVDFVIEALKLPTHFRSTVEYVVKIGIADQVKLKNGLVVTTIKPELTKINDLKEFLRKKRIAIKKY